MIFLKRPISADDVRAACIRFNEGLRVEYKQNFDASVREKLPKIVSSFANSQGGTLLIGVQTKNGVPEAPFNGFARAAKEEYELTVQSICLKGINPPVLPRTEVVPAESGNVFLVVEIDESSQAPHAIENSTKVYVRTGNASDLYEPAKVDEIIELVKRRREPLELRERLFTQACSRADKITLGWPCIEMSICPTYPRVSLSAPNDIWTWITKCQFDETTLVPSNCVRRIPDGAATIVRRDDVKNHYTQYFEVNQFGLLFVRRTIRSTGWSNPNDSRQQLNYQDVLYTILRLGRLARWFFEKNGFRGLIASRIKISSVYGKPMRFLHIPGPLNPDSPDDYTCLADEIVVDRFGVVEEILGAQSQVLEEVLSEITWSFWQSNQEFPSDSVREAVRQVRTAHNL